MGAVGRERVYDQYGKDISITDGRWIITLGQFGAISFIAGCLLSIVGAARALNALADYVVS